MTKQKPKIMARAWLKGHGINKPNGRDFKRYIAREKSAEQDPATGIWMVDANAPDPRLPVGRPRSAK